MVIDAEIRVFQQYLCAFQSFIRSPRAVEQASSIKAEENAYFYRRIRLATLCTGGVGEAGFLRPKGLTMGAAARTLPRLLSINVVAITPPRCTQPVGADP
jgi:hypothetical protein